MLKRLKQLTILFVISSLLFSTIGFVLASSKSYAATANGSVGNIATSSNGGNTACSFHFINNTISDSTLQSNFAGITLDNFKQAADPNQSGLLSDFINQNNDQQFQYASNIDSLGDYFGLNPSAVQYVVDEVKANANVSTIYALGANGCTNMLLIPVGTKTWFGEVFYDANTGSWPITFHETGTSGGNTFGTLAYDTPNDIANDYGNYATHVSFELSGTPTTYTPSTCSDGTRAGSGGACNGTAPAGSKTPATLPTCESTGGPLSWFICAALNTLNSIEAKIINVVQTLLTTNPINFNANSTCASSSTCVSAACANANDVQSCINNYQLSTVIYKVWSNFRVYGDILLVIGILAAIIIEAVGGGSIAEAYTVKRMLPRILAAAILINLSIYLVAAAEDIINIIGNGIRDLLLYPFASLSAGNTLSIHISGTTGALGSLAIAGIGVGLGFAEGIPGIALIIVSTFVIAAIGVLITLMIRQGLLVLLVITSPIAFALYCLPNTEQYFRKWWDLLLKTLLVFPITMAIIAAASIAAIVVSNFNIQPTILSNLMAMLAAAAPMFLIPFAFRMSGGVIGQASNAINQVAGRVREPIRNARQANRRNRAARARENNLFRGDNAFSRRGSALAQGVLLAPRAGLNPLRMRSRYAAARSAHTSAAAAKVGENELAAAIIQNDDLLNASLAGSGSEEDARLYLSRLGQQGSELEQNVASISQAKRDVGKEAFEDAAVVALAGTGTGYSNGPAEMLEAINHVAGNDRARAARLLAGARGQAERARRVDLYGAGFATSADQLQQLYNNHTNAATTNRVMTEEALLTKGAGEVASARNNSLTNMSGAMVRRMADAQSNVDAAQNAMASARAGGHPAAIASAQATLDQAVHEQKRVLAHTAGLLDVAGQVAPENAQLLGGLLGQTMPGGQTVGAQIEALRSDPEFYQYRREYSSGVPTGAQQGALQQAAGQQNAAQNAAANQGNQGGPTPLNQSDLRLKTDVQFLYKLNNSINIYSFRYKWGGPTYVGVIAQEVIADYPDAVIEDSMGYYWVDYSLLGMRMQTLEEWHKNEQKSVIQQID